MISDTQPRIRLTAHIQKWLKMWLRLFFMRMKRKRETTENSSCKMSIPRDILEILTGTSSCPSY